MKFHTYQYTKNLIITWIMFFILGITASYIAFSFIERSPMLPLNILIVVAFSILLGIMFVIGCALLFILMGLILRVIIKIRKYYGLHR